MVSTAQHNTTQCNATQCHATQCNAIRCSTTQCIRYNICGTGSLHRCISHSCVQRHRSCSACTSLSFSCPDEWLGRLRGSSIGCLVCSSACHLFTHSTCAWAGRNLAKDEEKERKWRRKHVIRQVGRQHRQTMHHNTDVFLLLTTCAQFKYYPFNYMVRSRASTRHRKEL